MGDIVLIPRDMKESRWSIFSWTPTSQVKSFAAEEKLLSHSLSLAGTESSLEKPACEIGLVQISEDRFINTLSIKAKTHTDKNVVILHGYGAGLGFFYRNFAPISKESGFNLYSLDWLGMANSSRPIFPRVKRLDTVEEVVHKTEQFFVESLEDWRKVMKLEKMTLVGHSLGGYLSTAYALKYPEHVEKLILVSPVGVPSLPKNYLMQPKTAFRSLVTSMWSSNITPMSVVRSMGPLGPRLVRSYTSRRFAHLDKAELASLDSYAFHITAQSGSGEYALARLLLPGAFAKVPLRLKFPSLKMPTTFLYGNEDWMGFHHAVECAPTMSNVKVGVVQDAGHHLYLDNPVVFNSAILSELSGNHAVPIAGFEYVYK